jgi:hypothetical protein
MWITALAISGLVGYLGVGLLFTVCLVHLKVYLYPFSPENDAAFFIIFWPIIIPFTVIYFLQHVPSQINRKLNKLVKFLTSS